MARRGSRAAPRSARPLSRPLRPLPPVPTCLPRVPGPWPALGFCGLSLPFPGPPGLSGRTAEVRPSASMPRPPGACAQCTCQRRSPAPGLLGRETRGPARGRCRDAGLSCSGPSLSGRQCQAVGGLPRPILSVCPCLPRTPGRRIWAAGASVALLSAGAGALPTRVTARLLLFWQPGPRPAAVCVGPGRGQECRGGRRAPGEHGLLQGLHPGRGPTALDGGRARER